MEFVDQKKIKRINSYEFTFDINEMSKHECTIIYQILTENEQRDSMEEDNLGENENSDNSLKTINSL